MSGIMEVDVVTTSGIKVRTHREIVGYRIFEECPHIKVPIPFLLEGEVQHYVFGSLVPLIIQTGA